ncbi:hypothetical protein Trydic_g13178 [Trypoxylus dichotomus]
MKEVAVYPIKRPRRKITRPAEDRAIVIKSNEIDDKQRPKPVSITTVKRRLRQADSYGRITVGKPLLRKAKKANQLTWARRLNVGRKYSGPTNPNISSLVIIWGSFGSTSVGDLVKIDVILTKEGYKEILERNTISSLVLTYSVTTSSSSTIRIQSTLQRYPRCRKLEQNLSNLKTVEQQLDSRLKLPENHYFVKKMLLLR